MRNSQRWGTILIFMLIGLWTISLSSIPPHPRVKKMIQEKKIDVPYFLQHRGELVQRGVNAPWSSPDIKKQSLNKPLGVERTLGSTTTPHGSWRALAILVKFSDKPSSVDSTSFDNLLFKDTVGTVRNYYKVVSYGNLDIVTVNLPSSLSWTMAPQPYSYYVNGQNGFGAYPQNAQKLVEDVIAAVAGSVDFSQYDNDHDGYVDALFVIHTGPGAEFTGSNSDIWSHSWTTSTPLLHNGVYVYHYSMEPEYWLTPGDMTCGVFDHELGHAAFGLPDLYDTDYSSEGLGDWSIMAGGSWNGALGLGDSPSFPDAWCQFQMGFLTPTNVTSALLDHSINNAENNSEAYRLWTNGATNSEYYLVQNRQQTSYDTYLPGSGVLIYHVDESVTTSNTHEWYPGDTANGHYLVALEQADGLYNLERNMNRGDMGDPYPGSSLNRNFTSTSIPNSNAYSSVSTNLSVRNISNSSAVMSADLQVGLIPGRFISVTPDTVKSGIAFIGIPHHDTVFVYNIGSDPLTVSSIISTSPVYTPGTTSFTLPAGGIQSVALTFAPTDTVAYNGTLSITSNDTSHAVVQVVLIGKGAYAPAITVAPDSFAVSLVQNDSTTRTLTIGNTGQGLLSWNSSPFSPDMGISLFSKIEKNIYSKAKIAPKSLIPQKGQKNVDKHYPAHKAGIVANANAMIHKLSQTEISESIPLFGIDQLGISQINPVTGAKIHSAALSMYSGGPHGLCYDGSVLYFIDGFGINRLVRIDAKQLSIIDTIKVDFPAYIDGLATNGKSVFALDYNNSLVYEVDISSKTLVRTLDFNLSIGGGMSYAGNRHSFFIGSFDNKIYEIDAIDGHLINSFSTTITTYGVGYSCSGNVLFIGDYGSQTQVLNPNTGEIISSFSGGYDGLASDECQNGFITLNPSSGSVAPKSSQDVSVKFNSKDLQGGDYQSAIAITSNDPVNSPKNVSASLHVIGRPLIVVNPDTVKSGITFIGIPHQDTVVVRNAGSEPLIVSNVSSSLSVYTPGITNFTVSAGGTQAVALTFSPTDTVVYNGTLTISSNDTSHALVQVLLTGKGAYAPVITVVPDSFAVSVVQSDSTTRTLTIGNNGQGPLNWTVGGSLSALNRFNNPSRDRSKDIIRPTTDPRESDKTNIKYRINKASLSSPIGNFYDGFESGNFNAWDTVASGGIKEVTMSTAAEGMYSFHYKNIATGHGHGISRNFVANYRPEYVGFFVRTGSTSLASGYFRLDGDTLGLSVIWFFAYPNGMFYVNGDVGGDNTFVYNSNQWYHVEFRNIDWVNKIFDYYVNNQLIKADIPFRNATTANQFGRLYLYNFDQSDAWWDGIGMGVQSNWLTISPSSGTVTPSTTQNVTVKFNAKDLQGGDYRSVIAITSNDPVNSPKNVPASMHVIGRPMIVVNPDTVKSGIAFIGIAHKDTVIVRNTGSEPLVVSNVSSNLSVYTPSMANFTVPSGSMQAVALTFIPTDSIAYNGTLSITSNDTSHAVVHVVLTGRGVYPPVLTVTPDSIAVALAQNDSTIRTLIIGNTGKGVLNWSIGNNSASLITKHVINRQYAKLLNMQTANQLTPTLSVPRLAGTYNGTSLYFGISDYGEIMPFQFPIGVEHLEVGTYASGYTVAFMVGTLDHVEWAGFATRYGITPVSYNEIQNDSTMSIVEVKVHTSGNELEITRRFTFIKSSQYVRIETSIKNISGSAISNIAFKEWADWDDDGVTSNNWGYDSKRMMIYAYEIHFTTIVPMQTPSVMDIDGWNDYQRRLTDGDVPPDSISNYDGLELLHFDLGSLSPGNNFSLANVYAAGNTLADLQSVVDKAGAHWLSCDPSSGTIASGSNQNITVKFNSKGLQGGDYQSVIAITNNDPINNPKNVPASMHVIGRPMIAVTPDTVKSGIAFIGIPHHDTVIVHNAGSEPLIVSNVSSSLSVYTPSITNFTVPSGGMQPVVLTFTPTDTVAYNGTLTIASNDSVRGSVHIVITGRGVYPPVITVTPDSIAVTLMAGDSTTKTITIGNVGRGTLTFSLTNIAGINQSSVSTSLLQNSQIVQTPQPVPIAKNIPASTTSLPKKITFDEMMGLREKSSSTQSTTIKAVVLDSWGSDYGTAIWDSLNANYASFGQSPIIIDYVSLNKDNITYADLVSSGADVLIISDAWSSGLGWEFSNAEWAAIKQYVEEGHGLIATSGSLDSYDAPNNSGHLAPMLGLDSTVSYIWSGPAQSLNFVQYPHPLLNGMNQPYQPGELITAMPSSNWNQALRGAQLIAISPDSTTCIIVYRNRVYVSNIPEYVPVHDDYQLLYNAIVWTSTGGSSWLSENPTRGAIVPSSTQNIAVKFNAKSLSGGDYRSVIAIASNDPGNAMKSIPVHLTVDTIISNVAINGPVIPKAFALDQNYPNPFNPSTTIKYALPEKSMVKIEVFNILGQLVARLVDGEKEAGYQSIIWNANVSTGIYFYRISAVSTSHPGNQFKNVKKMLLMK